MSETARLGLPLIEPAQAQKHITHNEALARLDALVGLSAKSRTLAVPPPAPVEADMWLVAAGASGAWSGKDGQIALWEAGGWVFLVPRLGLHMLVEDSGETLVLTAAGWRTHAGDSPVFARLGIGATPDATNRLSVRSPAALFAAVDAGSGGSGDARLIISKEASTNTGSLLFQTNWSGRAEIGNLGSDDFGFKVSAAGVSWITALSLGRSTGYVNAPTRLRVGSASAPAYTLDVTGDLNYSGNLRKAGAILGTATASVDGFMSAAQAGKLAGIEVAAEVNAAETVGAGAALFAGSKNGTALRFRSLVAGDNIDLQTASDSITLHATESEQVLRSLRVLHLYAAEQRGDRMNMVDGIADPFADGTDIDTGLSGNIYFDPYYKCYSPTLTFGPNLLPAMTAATTSGVTISASTQAAGFEAWQAADQVTTTAWRSSGSGNQWLRFDLGTSRMIGALSVRAANSLLARSPATLNYRTSTNGSSFVTNTPRTGLTWVTGETKTLQVAQLRSTRYIEILMSALPSGGDGLYEVGEIGFHEFVDIADMSLVSVAFDASIAPAQARLSLQAKTMHLPIVLNTHLIAEASRDDGATWTAGPLVFIEALADGLDIYEAAIDLSAQPVGTLLRYRVRTQQGAYVRVGGVVFQWGI